MRVKARQFVNPIWNKIPEKSNMTVLRQSNAQIAALERTSRPNEIIDVEYVDLNSDEVGQQASTRVATQNQESKFVQADQTAYARYQDITAFDRGLMFQNDLEEHANPYTDRKRDDLIAKIRCGRSDTVVV